MPAPAEPQTTPPAVLERARFDDLLGALTRRGYRLVGPTVEQQAIVYDEISSSADLPAGWTDEQEGGTYRLARRSDEALFGYAVGPQSWKRFLHPPLQTLWRATRDGDGGFDVADAAEPPSRDAYIAVRSCDLHAIRSLDDALLNVPHPDARYAARRAGVFVVALNCGEAGGTCFCVSMNTGPRASSGFDIAMTEVLEDGRHYFVLEPGSEAGAEVIAELGAESASGEELGAVDRTVARAASRMGRELDTDGLKELLYANYEHPRWDEVADRCLTCGNCTMVCPTCFCTTVEDTTDLTGDAAERVQKWDSCYTMDFTYLHGGSVRSSHKARYRQWMTHKLATWLDQFESSNGCVGCGRCITWCPVAIDITEEAAAIRKTDLRNGD